MKYIITVIVKQLLPTACVPTPLGRWRLDRCTTQLNYKIDLSNEDHCGPCGQYALENIKENNKAAVEGTVSKEQ
jgi:hypothetical protein